MTTPHVTGEAVKLSAPPALGLATASALRDELIAARGRPLDLDASQVQRVGGLGLQILLSAAKTWREDGVAFSVSDPSAEFINDLQRMGVDAASLASGQECNV